jgi:hypothetical protein
MFSVLSVPGLVVQLSQFIVAVVRNEKLVAEDGDTSGTQRTGKSRCWKPLSGNGEDGEDYVCCSYSDLWSV